ncbi:MAG: hypothetical protein J3Q66DRAFT_327853 [Benniella sp.]|nr:MAG: hypothetical protein J3Q66DRAFT_327853 [Benniella sp.]
MPRKICATGQITAGLVLSFALSSIVRISHAQPAPVTTITVPSPVPTNDPINTAPNAFLGVASATGIGVIYYHGGQLNTNTTQFSNELIALDVTKPWDISSPAWKNLTSPNGPPGVSEHSATMSKDLSTLYITVPLGDAQRPFLYQYDVDTGTWASENAPPAQASQWSNRRDAQLLTDFSTGAIWFLGGSLPGNTETNEIDKYQGGSWSANIPTTSWSNPSSIATMSRFSVGTSHLVDTKIYLFGGVVSGDVPRSYRNFQSIPWIDISTSTPTIGAMMTLGHTPPPRQDHCSVLTASKKVIIFGGYDGNTRQTFSDMWILDLVTSTWRQIIPVTTTEPRYGHTCTIVGANMIVFGGRASSETAEIGYSKDVQVYDVMESMWMKTYTPKEDNTPISEPHPDGTGPNSGSHHHAASKPDLSVGALVAVVFTIVLVFSIVLGVTVYRRRQKRIELRESELEKAAYMASLGPEGEDRENLHGSPSSGHGRRRQHSRDHFRDPRTGSTRHLNGASSSAANTPGMSHLGLSGVEFTGRDQEFDPTYTAPPEQSGVQYLMQQLPDGTIAVQPVYLNHQPVPLQPSPNMAYSETSSLGGLLGGGSMASSPVTSAPGASLVGTSYIAPPPPAHFNDTITAAPSSSVIASTDDNAIIPAPPASTRNPFTSPSAN